jgi:hypothetical protein
VTVSVPPAIFIDVKLLHLWGPRAAQRPRKAAMTGHPNPVRIAAEFLRKRLAKGPVLVSELEVAARAVGLLGNAQRITHAKLFKRAKEVSRHSIGSEWIWIRGRMALAVG